jgi:hypothetical protein
VQTVRELPVRSIEVMLDVGNFEWVTVYVIGKNAIVQPPRLMSTQRKLKSLGGQNEVCKHLAEEFNVNCIMFPEGR